MAYYVHVFLLLVGAQVSVATDLLLEGASAWATPSRVKRCPAHCAVKAKDPAGAASGVEFSGTCSARFSLIEMEVPDGSLADFGGLKLRFTGTLPAWTIRLGYGDSGSYRKERHIAVLDGTSEESMFVPWRYFKGQSLHVGSINFNGESVDAKSVRTIGIMVYHGSGGIGAGNFRLRELEASPIPQGVDSSLARPVFLNSNGEVSSSVNAQCSCDSGCARCALLKQLSSGICSSSQYEQLCIVSAGGLMSRLAAGFSTEGCTSEKQVQARRWLQTSQYLENCLPNHGNALASVIQDLMQGLLRTHFSAESNPESTCDLETTTANLTGFVGPFSAMGISGWNDLGLEKGVTVAQCLDFCRANSKCRSIDYGARDKVIGECWLSTANRESAGDAYEPWPLYDYYEVSDDGEVSTSDGPMRQNAGQQAAALTADQKKALLEAAGLVKLESETQLDCCKQPSSCIKGAIAVGVQRYNGGDVVSCFFLYHTVAERIGQCGNGAEVDYKFLMEVSALTGASDVSPNSAAWQLRRALDMVLALKSTATCGASFPAEDDVAAVPSPSSAMTATSAKLDGELANNFVGPFEGMGISGNNDLSVFYGKSVPDCLAECMKDSQCKSVDYGARQSVTGECWLSTANRDSASSAYQAWALYDYYERVIPPAEGASSGSSSSQSQEGTTDDARADPLQGDGTASGASEFSCYGVAMLILFAFPVDVALLGF